LDTPSASEFLKKQISSADGHTASKLACSNPSGFRDFGIEASAAELPVSPFDGAVVDDVVTWRALATIVTTDLVARGGFEGVHVE